VGELNLVVRGWGNYFRLGSVSEAYRAVDGHLRYRLRQISTLLPEGPATREAFGG